MDKEGAWTEGGGMDRTTRDALIAAYKEGYQVVVDALEGITEAQRARWVAEEHDGAVGQ